MIGSTARQCVLSDFDRPRHPALDETNGRVRLASHLLEPIGQCLYRRSGRPVIDALMNCLRRNRVHIERLLEPFPIARRLPLSGYLPYRYRAIEHVYAQRTNL